MKFITILLPLFLVSSSPQIDEFDWLIGIWEGVNNTGHEQHYEVWDKLGSHTYKGMGYTLKAGDTVFVEKLSIDNIYGIPHYTAHVQGNDKPVHFEVIKAEDGGFVCANPEHDFPKQIEYTREDDRLTATISGNGKSRSFIFKKKK